MATVIDALIVTLGLDGAKFKKGSKEVEESLDKTSGKANKANKEMEAWGKNAAASMSKLRNEVLGLLAVFTAGVGIKQFIDNTITSTASLGRMSENLDMSAKGLAMWQLANKNAGGSVEGMTAQLKEAQQAIADYKLGKDNASNSAFFSSGGTDAAFKDAETLLRSRADLTAKISQRFGVGIAQRKAAEFGISEDTFNLIKQGSVEIDKLRYAQEKLALEQARASGPAEEFRKKWDTVKNQFEAIGVKILTGLMPQLIRLTDWLAANQDKIEAWANKAVTAIESFVKWADKAAESVGGWKNVLIALIGLNILSAVAPLVALGASLVSIGAALGVIGGAAGTSAMAVLGRLASAGVKIGVGGALLLHTEELNSGESDELARRRALGDADFAKRGIGPNGKPLASSSGGASGSWGDSAAASAGGSGPAAFAAKYGAAAAKAGAALGVDSRTILGQWGLETGWGKSVIPGTNNLGNIKDFSGGGVAAKDNMTGSVDKYRSYASADQFADDYVNLIKRKYPKAVGAATAESFAQALKSGGYAEDPAYVAKLARASQMAGLSGAAGAASATQVAQAAGSRSSSSGSTNTSSSETNFNGPISIYTPEGGAEGVAKGLKQAVNKYNFASQANTGLA